MDDVLGLTIHGYQIGSLLAEGGMGRVYAGRHLTIGRKAAFKIMRADLLRCSESCSRFLAEARIANAIRHPNIIEILDAGLLPDGQTPYLLMEYLEGETLGSRIERQGRLSPLAAREIAYQVALALGAAHAAGVIHRDVKPGNLFLVPDNTVETGERVKILDFGVAKLCEDARGGDFRTRTGGLLGTVAYMSPEQCSGFPEKVDHRTDIYSLGVVLYEMLSGRPPFFSQGQGDLLMQHMTKPPPPLRDSAEDVPPDLEEIVHKTLAKDPNDRFQSMAELQCALLPKRGDNRSSSLPVSADDLRTKAAILTGAAPKTMTRPRHRKIWAVAGLAGMLALLLAAKRLVFRSDEAIRVPPRVVKTVASAPPETEKVDPPSAVSENAAGGDRIPQASKRARGRMPKAPVQPPPAASVDSTAQSEPLQRQGGLRW